MSGVRNKNKKVYTTERKSKDGSRIERMISMRNREDKDGEIRGRGGGDSKKEEKKRERRKEKKMVKRM